MILSPTEPTSNKGVWIQLWVMEWYQDGGEQAYRKGGRRMRDKMTRVVSTRLENLSKSK
jgi:hypothetical protein